MKTAQSTMVLKSDGAISVEKSKSYLKLRKTTKLSDKRALSVFFSDSWVLSVGLIRIAMVASIYCVLSHQLFCSPSSLM